MAYIDRLCGGALLWDSFYGAADYSRYWVLVFFQKDPCGYPKKLHRREYRRGRSAAIYLQTSVALDFEIF